MNEIEFTKLMLELRETYDKLQELEAQVKAHVLSKGRSQQVADIAATYYNPSTVFDYEGAGKAVRGIDLTRYTTVVETIRWKDVCKAYGLFPDHKEKPARVVLLYK